MATFKVVPANKSVCHFYRFFKMASGRGSSSLPNEAGLPMVLIPRLTQAN